MSKEDYKRVYVFSREFGEIDDMQIETFPVKDELEYLKEGGSVYAQEDKVKEFINQLFNDDTLRINFFAYLNLRKPGELTLQEVRMVMENLNYDSDHAHNFNCLDEEGKKINRKL